MNTEPFKKIAELTLVKKSIEEQIDAFRKEAEAEMVASGTDKVESDYGSFFFSERKKWEYTDAVTEIEGKLKKLKKTEEDSGKATFELSKVLTFRLKGNGDKTA